MNKGGKFLIKLNRGCKVKPKGECLQAKQTASKGFINSSRQPLTHYY